MKLYEVTVEHEQGRGYSSYYQCNQAKYHVAAETEADAKFKAIERFKNEMALCVKATAHDVEVVESPLFPSPEVGQPWWKRITS